MGAETVEQQIENGRKQIEDSRRDDGTLDRDYEARAYMQELADRLLATQPPLPYPITIHISYYYPLDAVSFPGGQIVLYTRLIEKVDEESQLVAVLAHELSHEQNQDVANRHKHQNGEDLSFSEMLKIEERADADAARMMYAAGWDPRGVVSFRLRMNAGSLGGSFGERIRALEKVVASLPPKPGLITDSPRFQKIRKGL